MISKINKIWYDRDYKEYYNLKEKVEYNVFYFAAAARPRAPTAEISDAAHAADKPKAALKVIMFWFAWRLDNVSR